MSAAVSHVRRLETAPERRLGVRSPQTPPSLGVMQFADFGQATQYRVTGFGDAAPGFDHQLAMLAAWEPGPW
jgi:hypothetical protein